MIFPAMITLRGELRYANFTYKSKITKGRYKVVLTRLS